MADNDIQFLGNWNSQEASSNSTFVSAIVLTPIRSGNMSTTSPFDAARTFSRTQTSVVHVGRVPPDPALTPPADDRASYVNPVMSRNHAKITFADSGSAFVIDTNSHHGTWVARPSGLNNSFKLAPESPFQLQDGDKLTFGKEVQKNGTCHEPLTVAVKLLRTAAAPSTISISSGSATPMHNFASPKPRNRFGLDPSSDSDSDASCDSEDSKDKDPCTGPNAIRVELPFKRSEKRILALDTPKPSKSSRSESFSSSSTPHSPITPQRSPMLRVSYSPGTPVYSPLPAYSPTSPCYSPALELPSLSPGLELEGMGSQISMPPSNPDPHGTTINIDVDADEGPSAILETTDPIVPDLAPPPWRRPNLNTPWSSLNTALNVSLPPTIFDRMPDLLPQPPRRIGRLFNPLWMRSVRGAAVGASSESANTSSGIEEGEDALERHGRGHGHGHGHGHGRGPGRRGRLDADWGLFGQSGSEVRDDMKRLKERVDEFRKEVEAMKTKSEEEGTGLHDVLSAKLDGFARQMKVLQDANIVQQTVNNAFGEVTVLKAMVAALKCDLTTFTSNNVALKDDVAALRAQQATLGADVARLNDSSELGTNDIDELMGDVARLRNDARVLKDDFGELTIDGRTLKTDVGRFRGEFAGLQGDVETLQGDFGRVDATARKVASEVQDMKAAQATAEQDLRARIREEVRSELYALKEQDSELSSLSGKRKRGHDEAFSSPDDALILIPAPPASRPRKRLRIVVDCAAAGAVGAVGAWLGLAFL